eukprot:jgi/Botrbrau1/7279/Bobra.0318s0016.1
MDHDPGDFGEGHPGSPDSERQIDYSSDGVVPPHGDTANWGQNSEVEAQEEVGEDEEVSEVEEEEVEDRCRNCSEVGPKGCPCKSCGYEAVCDSKFFYRDSPLPPVPNARPVALIHSKKMERHDVPIRGYFHFERPDRIEIIWNRLKSSGLTGQCRIVEPRVATVEELKHVHSIKHIKEVLCLSREVAARCREEDFLKKWLESHNTYFNEHTIHCALLSAGSCIRAIEQIVSHGFRAAAAIVRPPGHHAEANLVEGFCVFNNAAIAARYAQNLGKSRILILDWDVHHGNGTQSIFEEDPTLLYISVHRYDGGKFYPGSSGDPKHVGLRDGKGFNVNIGWNEAGIGDIAYYEAFETIVLPITEKFNPELVIISAGFDAAEGDPLGECKVSPGCFANMTQMMVKLGPTALFLEGGYNLKATAECTEACLRVMMGEPPPPKQISGSIEDHVVVSIYTTLKLQVGYWDCLHDKKKNFEKRHASVLERVQRPELDEAYNVKKRQRISSSGDVEDNRYIGDPAHFREYNG